MRLHRLLAAALLATAPGLAVAGEYTLFIYETDADFALRDQQSPEAGAYWAAYGAAAAAMAQAGIMRGGAPLEPVGHAVGTALPVSGDLKLGGYFRIEVPDLAEALRWAGTIPAAARGGAVEVRATAATPQM